MYKVSITKGSIVKEVVHIVANEHDRSGSGKDELPAMIFESLPLAWLDTLIGSMPRLLLLLLVRELRISFFNSCRRDHLATALHLCPEGWHTDKTA
jgi:hypothetical protein